MLERDLNRISRELGEGILAMLREASIDELADLIPSVGKLKAQAEAAEKLSAQARKREASASNGHARAPQVVSTQATDAILKALEEHPEGLRSEEIQRRASLDSRSLRVVLGQMVEDGKLCRVGKARGTRYALPDSPVVTQGPEAVSVLPEVDVNHLNAVRNALAQRMVPLTVGDLEKMLDIERSELRRVLERLSGLGLASREQNGPVVRYRFASQSAPSAAGPRVVRRPPRAKGWQPAAGGQKARGRSRRSRR